jgi:GNAT superfamily N-acetyltransferase
MVEADIATAQALSLSFNWPHRPEDWAFLLDLGDGIVAETSGGIVGTAIAVRYGPDLATIGMVIVDRALHGRGLGRRLMDALLQQHRGRVLVLNATDEGAPLYQKLGFSKVGRVYQYQIILPATPAPSLQEGEHILPLAPDDDRFAAAYSGAAGSDRAALVGMLQRQGEIALLCRGETPAGFAALRRFGRGWTIGPVVAVDQRAAQALILHWLHQKTGAYTRIDVTDESGLSPWLDSLGLPRVSAPQTMALGRLPERGGEFRVFALTSQALG